MTWKESVREELIRYHEQKDTDELTLREFYDFAEQQLSSQYPDNNHVRAKIRQVLQQLRDSGDINFVDGDGTYRIDNTDDQVGSSDDPIDTEIEQIEILSQIKDDFSNL